MSLFFDILHEKLKTINKQVIFLDITRQIFLKFKLNSKIKTGDHK